MIKTECPNCQTEYNFEDFVKGRTINCANCKNDFIVKNKDDEFLISCPHCNEEYEVDSSFLGQKVQCAYCEKDFIAEELINAKCSNCEKIYKLSKKLIGQKIHCSSCNENFTARKTIKLPTVSNRQSYNVNTNENKQEKHTRTTSSGFSSFRKLINSMTPTGFMLGMLGFSVFVIILGSCINPNEEKEATVDTIGAYIYAQGFVKQRLKSPSSAKFTRYSDNKVKYKGDVYIVQLTYDAQNSFGAMIRETQYVKMIRVSNNNWQLMEITEYPSEFLNN